MQLSQINKPSWFVAGVVLGVVFTLIYSNLMSDSTGAKNCPKVAASVHEDRYCPSCPVCPDGSKPGLHEAARHTQEAPATSCPEPLPCPKCKECQACPEVEACPKYENATDSGALVAVGAQPNLGVHRVSNPLVETPGGTHLGLVQPIYELQDGKIKLPKGIKRIALDVGTSLLSPSSASWFKNFPQDLMVLAFEPNKFSHSLIAYTSHPSMALNPKRFVFFSLQCKMYKGERIGPTLVQWYTNCMNTSYAHLINHRAHFWPANTAISNRNGFATFNLGVGDPGVGSLYDFKPGTEWTRPEKQHEAWGHAHVPKIRLDSVLQYIPEDITFELLKVDAQGHDAEVVQGVGRFLPRFKCLIGEFDTNPYAGADKKDFDYLKLLKSAGFRSAGDGVWVNKRFASDFHNHRYLCTAYDVIPTHNAVVRAVQMD